MNVCLNAEDVLLVFVQIIFGVGTVKDIGEAQGQIARDGTRQRHGSQVLVIPAARRPKGIFGIIGIFKTEAEIAFDLFEDRSVQDEKPAMGVFDVAHTVSVVSFIIVACR